MPKLLTELIYIEKNVFVILFRPMSMLFLPKRPFARTALNERKAILRCVSQVRQ